VPKIAEVREIENVEQGQKRVGEEQKEKNKSTITESLKEAVIPTVHASDDDEKVKAAFKGALGGTIAAASVIPSPVQPVAGAVATGETVAGLGTELAGEVTDNENLKESGRGSQQIGAIGSAPSLLESGVKGGVEGLKKLFG